MILKNKQKCKARTQKTREGPICECIVSAQDVVGGQQAGLGSLERAQAWGPERNRSFEEVLRPTGNSERVDYGKRY